jgi:Putative Flp pilus-assembly TadE/G-like
MNLTSERGATFVHVGVILLGLTAFSGFVIDQGVLVVARRQAQNLADAGAHAGAVARAFDDTSDEPPSDSGVIYDSIVATVQQGEVWGEPIPTTAIGVSYDCPAGVAGHCVRADVHRDGTSGSAELPTYFMRLVGKMSQPVRATATVHVAPANATRCLQPFMIPDFWTDDGNGQYDEGEAYGTPGYTTAELGDAITLSPGNPSGPVQLATYYMASDAGGLASVEPRVVNCAMTGRVGRTLDSISGPAGATIGNALRDLIDQDSEASWNGTTVVGGKGLASPRVVVIGLFDPAVVFTEQAGKPTGSYPIAIVNMLAVFIDDADGSGAVNGHIVSRLAEYDPNLAQVPPGASFLKAIELVR